MTIDLLLQQFTLKHITQNEIQAAQKKSIKEHIGVAKDEESTAKVITVDEEDNNNKRKTMKVFDTYDSPQKTMSLSATADNPKAGAAEELLYCFTRCQRHEKLMTTWICCAYGAIRCDSYGLVKRLQTMIPMH